MLCGFRLIFQCLHCPVNLRPQGGRNETDRQMVRLASDIFHNVVRSFIHERLSIEKGKHKGIH